MENGAIAELESARYKYPRTCISRSGLFYMSGE